MTRKQIQNKLVSTIILNSVINEGPVRRHSFQEKFEEPYIHRQIKKYIHRDAKQALPYTTDLHFYGQELFALLLIFYNLQSCKIVH